MFYYYHRLLEKKLRRIGRYSPVIVLTGARQVGKTTLLRHLLPHANLTVFDPSIDVGNARQDPELFLDQLKLPVILDEIQYAPELLSVIKRRVDERPHAGDYWLTGSQNLNLVKHVSESLAGRAAILSLYPMTFSERTGACGHWLESYISDPKAFLNTPMQRILSDSQETLLSMLWKGGYPGLITREVEDFSDFLSSYFSTYIERDLRLISEVSDLHEFSRFVALVANLTAQEINFTELGREIGITPKTAARWLNILIGSYQWFEIAPYSGNTLKRISGKAKGYFIDTGLACHLMHISTPKALLGHPKLGSLFETAVVNDILRQIPLLPGKPAIYHWRSHAGAEVDLLLEMDNIYYPIEIKCKNRPSKHDISGIRSFRETYPHLNIAPALIICTAHEMHPIGNDCYALPFDLIGCSQ